MYKRIAEQFRDRYKSLVLSSPSLNGGPWIIQLDDFLTEEECQAMILETEKAIVSSPGHFAVMAEDLADENGGECVSTQVWCSNECMQKKALQSVKSKVEELVDMPWEQAEELHMIKYVPGQRYGNHHDFIYEEVESLHGPRLFTLLFYLNNPATGGETCFPDLNHPFCVHPKIGRAVIFPQVLNKDPEAKDNRTWHEAEGVVGGIKYSSTVWYHLRSYQRSREVGCAYIDDLDDEEMYESIYNDALDDNPITTIMEMLQNS
jgi:prolyl 4-hydroxylase